MDDYVISLSRVSHQDTHLVGGKAAALGVLFQVGFPVPNGICLTTAAFKHALTPYQHQIDTILQAADLQTTSGVLAASHEVMTLLREFTIPTIITSGLDPLLQTIANSGAPVAVRSSATAEDTPDVSFAGHYHSEIGVSGAHAVHAAVLAVWRSFYNPESLLARAKRSTAGQADAMAVLIMPVVEAQCSGVALSVDPIQPDENRVVITAAWGLGLGIVDGSVPTDTAWVRRDGPTEGFEIEEHRVVEKTTQVGIHDGKHSRLPVAPLYQRVACLPDSWLVQIAQFCTAAEVLFGCPQDMEWAVADNQVVILQSRPITALPKQLRQPQNFPVSWDSPEEARQAWIYYPYWRYVLKPLEIDYALDRASASKAGSCLAGRTRYWAVKIVNGRAYAAWAPLDDPPGHLRIRRMALQDLHARLHQQKQTTWEYWGPEIEQATRRLGAFDPQDAAGPAVAHHLENARGVYHRHWSMHGSQLWISRQPYYDALAALTGVPPDSVRQTANQLLEGLDNPSTQLIDGLYDLAVIARKNSQVAALAASPTPDVIEKLGGIPDAGEFLAALHEFMAAFGTRSGLGYGSDKTIIAPTWREQPELVMQLIAAYLDPTGAAPRSIRQRAQIEREKQITALRGSCPDEALTAAFEQELDFARRQAAIMEIHNHYIDQLMNGQLRQAVLYAADWLVDQGTLHARDDIFWLHFDEITTALRAGAAVSYNNEIAARQAQHLSWCALTPPPLIGVPEAKLPPRPVNQPEITPAHPDQDGKIQGIGASSGVYQGRARIIDQSVLLPDVALGDVLVAQNIGPRWTPIFPILGGIVLDGGSVGQHHAIVAREYGIPAVVGTGSATKKIPEGALVTLDGTTGIVQIAD